MRKLHHRNAMRLLALSDLLVAPSGFEACPYVALEAMSLGVPVIATAVGGFPELIEDGVSGFLAPVSGDEPPVVDTGTLARFQRELLTDETKRRAFARTSRDRAMQQFSLDLMLKGTISCYEEAIEVSRLPRCPAMKSAIYLKR
jgi:glycosyltransferase involved in cell wall biosynthesis